MYGSGPHVVAVTTNGQLYTWGHNGYGQLGQGISITIGQGCTPGRVRGVLDSVRVTKVACGGHHTLALTQGGEVSPMNVVLLCVSVFNRSQFIHARKLLTAASNGIKLPFYFFSIFVC